MPLTKQNLVDLSSRFENNDPSTGGIKWDTKINEENFKIHLKMKGSEITKDHMLIKSEMIFDA